MTYQECTEYLFSLHRVGIKLGLERVHSLSEALGRPQDRLKFVHIAGTNGKGSTAAFLESVLRTSGLRTGLYTSPHLVSLGERIRVDGVAISQEDIVRLTAQVRTLVESRSEFRDTPFFEFTTLMALLYFAEQGVELVVWETGLGGRLDATNIVIPECSVITGIGLDHTEFLGNSLEQVAREKAGIIKKDKPLILGACMEDAIFSQLCGEATSRDSRVHASPRPSSVTVDRARGVQSFSVGGSIWEISLKGSYQPFNAAVALEIVDVLEGAGWQIPHEARKTGLLNACWPGRFDVRRTDPALVVDGAHNPQGLAATCETWRLWYDELPQAIVFGCMSDKDAAGMAALLDAEERQLHLVPLSTVRGLDPHVLKTYFTKSTVHIHPSCGEALGAIAESGGSCLVTGSLYLAGEVLSLLDTQANELILNG